MESQPEPARQQRKALRIHPADNVAVALEEIPGGASVVVFGSGDVMVSLGGPIPFAHKVALSEIDEGGFIYKYGLPIAVATAQIARGEWVHEHNARSRVGTKGAEGVR